MRKTHEDRSKPARSVNWRTIFFDRVMLVMTGVMAICGSACWWLRGPEAFFDSFHSDLQTLLDILPKIALALVTAALVQALVPREFIVRWLGEKSGLKGVSIATGVGVITPGGPMMSFPIVSAMSNAGTGRAALIAYLTSWETLGFQRILSWEFPLMGVEYALIRAIASIPLPFIAAWMSSLLPPELPRDPVPGSTMAPGRGGD
jgi:uncharacterized membrane protein YraQ (UPF0718 family)